MKKIFVTGLSGFVGSTIRRMLALNGRQYGLELVVPTEPLELRDRAVLERVLRAAQPDCAIHLAAQSYVPASFENPYLTYEVNFFGTLNLLGALKETEFSGRLLYVGSADVYGRSRPQQLPITEDQPLKPRNPYAVSKVAAEMLCYQWSQTEGLDIVMARPFNHIGPGQSEQFVISDFARQMARVKLGQQQPIVQVGDIDVTRDFTDVRDVVHAYFALLEAGKTGEAYNVCSGKEHSIREMVGRLAEIAGVAVDIQQDVQRLRRAEQRRAVGSYEKLNGHTGWRPGIDIRQSLNDVVLHWEEILSNG